MIEIGVLIIVITVAFVVYAYLDMKYTNILHSKDNELFRLLMNHNMLNAEYKSLERQYDSLKEDYIELSKKITHNDEKT